MFNDINETNEIAPEVNVVPRHSPSLRDARSKLRRQPIIFFNASKQLSFENYFVSDLSRLIIEPKNNERNITSTEEELKDNGQIPAILREGEENSKLRNSFDEAAIEQGLREMDEMLSQLDSDDTDSVSSPGPDSTTETLKRSEIVRSESTEKLLSVIFSEDELKSSTVNNIKQLLNHESQHLCLLTTIQQYKYILKESKVSDEIIWNIFHNISDLIYAQKSLVNYLESMLAEWDNKPVNFVEIMDLYTLLHVKCKDYVKNNSIACRELKNLFDKHEKFKFAINTINFEGKEMRLEELISKPVHWLCNSLEHIKNLIESTDCEFDRLKMKETFQSLKENNNDTKKLNKNSSEISHFLRSSLFVELYPNDQRKLRHLFLFSGMVICARQKLQIESGTSLKHSQITPTPMTTDDKNYPQLFVERFEVKWFISLKSLVFHLSKNMESCDRRKNDIAVLKDKIRDLKLQLITEKNKLNTDLSGQSGSQTYPTFIRINSQSSKSLARSKSNNFSFRRMMIKKDVDKINNHILKIQKELLLISPSIPFIISNGPDKPHTLLVPSVKDLEVWKCEILKAQKEKNLIDCSGLSLTFVNNVVEGCRKYIPVIEAARNPLLHEDGLSGVLITNIHKLDGLNPEFRYSLSFEVDSFKLNELKARTKFHAGGNNLSWNESFDIDLDCSQTMSILVYEMKNYGENKESLIGYFDIELNPKVMNNETIVKSVPILSNESIKLTIEVFLKFEAKNESMKRQPSIMKAGLFGIPIKAIVAREKSQGVVMADNVPIVIAGCLKRIENSLDEEGIYRISGSKNEINELYKRLNKNTLYAIQNIADYDLHTITGIVKMYLRELPEPLMLTENYEKLMNIAKLDDNSERILLYQDVINKLPEPNHSTIIFLLKHFERVCAHSSKNQMIAGNLGLILGPTLIMPPCTSEKSDFGQVNIAFETMRSMFLARVFTHIMHGILQRQISLQ